MPQYHIVVTFDRKNPKTKVVEKDSVRESTFFAPSAQIAKEEHLHRFRKNEPTLIRIKKCTVEEVK